MGRHWKLTGKTKAAIAAYEKAIELDKANTMPGWPWVWPGLTPVIWKKTMQVVEKALKEHPNQSELQALAAQAGIALEPPAMEFPDAPAEPVEKVASAAELKEQAKSAEEAGNNDQAEALYKKAVEVEPDNHENWSALGMHYYNLEKNARSH